MPPPSRSLHSPGFLDEGVVAGQHRADRTAEALGEIDPDAVHLSEKRVHRRARGNDGVQQPRPVHMHLQPLGAGGLADGLQLLQRPDRAATGIMGLLEGHKAGLGARA